MAINLEKGAIHAPPPRPRPARSTTFSLGSKIIVIATCLVLLVLLVYAGIQRTRARNSVGQKSFQFAVTSEMVRSQVEAFVHASENGSVDRIVQSYAPSVDYFDHGEVDRDFVRQDIDQFRKRWPIHRETLVGDIQVSEADGVWSATYKSSFYDEKISGTEWVKGAADVVHKLVVVEGDLKISYIRAQITARERGNSTDRP